MSDLAPRHRQPNGQESPSRQRTTSAAVAAGWVVYATLGFLAIGTTGCAGEPEPEVRLPTPAANPELNLSFTDIPPGFEIVANQGKVLRLSSEVEGRDGTMWVEVSERSDYGIDLVKIVNAQKADYEGRDGGEYSGARELMTPAGKAFYVRGRYQSSEPGIPASAEETRVYLVHPTENRLVVFHYLYPAAEDSGERLPELFAWVAEMAAADSGVPQTAPGTAPTSAKTVAPPP